MSASTSRNVVLALGLAAMLSGCATKSDLDTLQNQAYRDRQESRRTIQKLEEQLTQTQEELREEIQKSTSPVQAKQANTWAELESMRMQVAKLQEKLDTLSVKFNAMTNSAAGGPSLVDVASDVQNIKTALQSQFGMDLGNAAAAAPPAETPALAAQAKAAPKAEAPKPAAEVIKVDTADALFAKADASFKARKYEEARQYYSEFATNFKKHPKTSEAVYWVGECALNLQDYGKAVLAYQEVIERFPKSTKYKSAVLKQGMAFFKIGKDKAGKAVLEDLIARFPSSPEAISAKKFLKDHK
ncbi:MAG: tetratricopeptide repeat protein [Humidesulfovibrio sp.]|uniref:tetratricopeptide repeat protein n=1 Tax=Humidesulfovibrio sp. TaxID=2910988 RepID=UPI002732546B|nr:tetratricopeptide repeat protein [Humidesulfovibrio sp.]MDP2848160.1 tetratricopeptide repeat protein [Humidesulfovibrio sp.]